MGRTLGKLGACHLNHFLGLVAGAAIGILVPSQAIGQVRGKLPDRGAYQPPRLGQTEASLGSLVERSDSLANDAGRPESPVRTESNEVINAAGDQTTQNSPGKKPRPLVAVVLDDLREPYVESDDGGGPRLAEVAGSPGAQLQQVLHEDVVLVPPKPPADFVEEPRSQPIGKLASYPHDVMEHPVMEHPVIDYPVTEHDTTCDGCVHCDSLACDSLACDSLACDSIGCDSMGGCPQPWHRRWTNASLCFDRDRWFGGIDYLMMWSRGDRLPALVTTDTSTTPNAATAGRLGQAGTLVLVGQDRIMQRLGSGGRVTIGTWLDERECLSLVGRGWYGGRKTYHYDQNQDQTSILVRPFLNVSDDQTPAQDTQIIAFPNRATGTVHVEAMSEVFGADVSLRQFLYGDLGVTFDFLYGYQFMRVNENLGIASNSTSLNEDFAPIGSMLSVADTFSVSNEFHGGQVGLASNYRERCWSFNALAKVGFGSLRRQATRTGLTVTTVDDVSAQDNNGLLVRSTNSGTVTDHTFGWVPELDFSLGWQRFAGWDLTFGYHIIAMTDALQSPGAIDPDLAVNLSDPPLEAQRPSDGLQFRTYYVQGIHFGLQHVY